MWDLGRRQWEWSWQVGINQIGVVLVNGGGIYSGDQRRDSRFGERGGWFGRERGRGPSAAFLADRVGQRLSDSRINSVLGKAGFFVANERDC